MTNPTPHGQVPEALRLAEQYDHGDPAAHGNAWKAAVCTELRRQHARIAELEAQIAAVGAGGVQALSAAPGVTSEQRRLIGVIADKIEDGTLFQSGIYPKKDLARFVRNMLDTTPTAPAASPTPPAEQQAAPKAAPVELSADSLRHQNKLLAETLGACILASGIVRKDIDGFTGPELLHFGEDLRSMLEVAPKQEAQEPVATIKSWTNGSYWRNYKIDWHRDDLPEDTKLYTKPQPAPAPLSDDTKRLAWMADEWTPEHEKLYDKHVLETGGVGGLDDLRTFIDKQIAAQGGK